MFSSDKPFPRGECIVKTRDMFPGYFNDDDRTKKAFTSDGFYKTGDLVELPSKGTIRVIGRRKHAIKLSKAQWVHPGALEIVFLRADVVEQIYVHGVANASYLVAIVHPDQDLLCSMFSSDFETLCKSKEAKEYVLNILRDMGNKANIQDYEHIKHVFLESEKFTEENKMMTSSRKLARPNIRVKYREILNEMLGLKKSNNSIVASKSSEEETEADEKTSLRKITKYCAALLGVSESELLDARTLSLHGLQSLGMQRVKSFLEQSYRNLHIPVEIVGACSVRRLGRIVDCSLSRFIARYYPEIDVDEVELQTIKKETIERYCEETRIEIRDLSDDVMSRMCIYHVSVSSRSSLLKIT